MNRRQFTQRLAALFAAPAMSANAVTTVLSAPVAAPVAMPAGAMYWANYLMKLHETCTPNMLGNMLGISEKAAAPLHRQLISQGVITPTGVVNTMSGKQPKRAVPKDRQTMHQENPTVRAADERDIDALARIWHDGWHEAHAEHVPAEFTALRTPESFAIRMPANLEQTLVVGPMGAPVGFSMVRADELYQIYVDPVARGRRVSDALLAAGETRLAEIGVENAILHVIPENQRAVAFYLRNGWSGDEIIDVALETLDEPFVVACRVLGKNLTGRIN